MIAHTNLEEQLARDSKHVTRLYQKRIESYLKTLKGIPETKPAATNG